MKKITFIGITALATMAMASMSWVAPFNKTYNIKPDSELGKAKCGACHTGKMGGKLNKYGTDLAKAANKSKTLTADILKKVEGLDSDGDGKKNGDELRAGTLP